RRHRRQGRLLREADDQDDRRGPRRRRYDAEIQPRDDGRRPVDGGAALARGQRADQERSDWSRLPGPNELLPQLDDGPVALLPALEGTESEDGRLGHVPRPQLPDQRRPAAGPQPAGNAIRSGRVRAVALLLAVR